MLIILLSLLHVAFSSLNTVVVRGLSRTLSLIFYCIVPVRLRITLSLEKQRFSNSLSCHTPHPQLFDCLSAACSFSLLPPFLSSHFFPFRFPSCLLSNPSQYSAGPILSSRASCAGLVFPHLFFHSCLRTGTITATWPALTQWDCLCFIFFLHAASLPICQGWIRKNSNMFLLVKTSTFYLEVIERL